jgi:hypothetical protein
MKKHGDSRIETAEWFYSAVLILLSMAFPPDGFTKPDDAESMPRVSTFWDSQALGVLESWSLVFLHSITPVGEIHQT